MLVWHIVTSFARNSKLVKPSPSVVFCHVSVPFLNRSHRLNVCMYVKYTIKHRFRSSDHQGDCCQTCQCLSPYRNSGMRWYSPTFLWWPPSDDLYQNKNTRYCSMTRLWALGPNAYRGVEHPRSAPHSELVKVLWVWTEWGMWTLTRSSASCERESSLKSRTERERGFEEHCCIIRGQRDTFWLLQRSHPLYCHKASTCEHLHHLMLWVRSAFALQFPSCVIQIRSHSSIYPV